MKIKLAALVITFLVCGSTAFAQSSATVNIKESEITASDTSSTLKLKINAKLDKEPKKDCEFVLFGTVSAVGVAGSQGKRREIAKVTKKGKSATFKYNGVAVTGEVDDLTQLNAQVRVKCGNKTIFSNVDSTNVTCDQGLEPGKFLKELQRITDAS